jgi:xanthine/uracil permease
VSSLLIVALLALVVFCFLLGWALAVVAGSAEHQRVDEDERFYIPTPEAVRLRRELGEPR